MAICIKVGFFVGKTPDIFRIEPPGRRLAGLLRSKAYETGCVVFRGFYLSIKTTGHGFFYRLRGQHPSQGSRDRLRRTRSNPQ
jgi:hypothetical protein